MDRKIIGLGVEIDGKKGFLRCDTEAWTLTLQYHDSDTPILETSMNNIKNIHRKSSYKTYPGYHQILGKTYSYIQIDTRDGQEIVVQCEEHAVFNNSWVFLQSISDACSSKYDPNYKKKRNFLAILGAIGVAIIIAAIHGLFIDI